MNKHALSVVAASALLYGVIRPAKAAAVASLSENVNAPIYYPDSMGAGYAPVSYPVSGDVEGYQPAIDGFSYPVYSGRESDSYSPSPLYSYEEPAPLLEIDLQSPNNPAPVSAAVSVPRVEDFGAANLVAFLSLIREAESNNDYTALVGGGNFASFDDHPAVTGEFKGIRRADGRLTTAAGAYQITRTTWLDIKGKTRFGNFSPASQDEAAVFLIKRRGAYNYILSGNFETAVSKLRNEWEFFVTQRWTPTKLASTFKSYGGVIV